MRMMGEYRLDFILNPRLVGAWGSHNIYTICVPRAKLIILTSEDTKELREVTSLRSFASLLYYLLLSSDQSIDLELD